MTADDPLMDHAFAEQRRRLAEEFGGILDQALIEQHFRAVIERFADAPVRTYVPIFAFRLAREALAQLCAAGAGSGR